MKDINRIIILLFALTLPSTAMAANFVCIADPAAYLAVGGDGTVYLNIENIGISGICSMSTQTGSVTPQGCTGWYSALLTQRTMNRKVFLQYDDANATNCSSYTAWTIHAPYYFVLNNN